MRCEHLSKTARNLSLFLGINIPRGLCFLFLSHPDISAHFSQVRKIQYIVHLEMEADFSSIDAHISPLLVTLQSLQTHPPSWRLFCCII